MVVLLKRLLTLLSVLLLLFVSCSDKEDLITIVNIIDTGKAQEAMNYIVNSRSQILDANYTHNVFSVRLQDVKYEIDTRIVPFIEYDKSGMWFVNGDAVDNGEQEKTNEGPTFPSLSISTDGRLVVNNHSSRFCLNPSTIDSISVHKNWIWAVARNGAYLYFYRADGANTKVPIIDNPEFVIPNYFVNCVVSKEKLAEDVIKDIPMGEYMSYVFFTDAHWYRGNQKHSPAIIKHIVDYTSIQQVLFGGDVITSSSVSKKEALEEGNQFRQAFSFLGSRLYCLFGNHDDNSCGQATMEDRHLSEEQVYSYLQSQMTNVQYWDYYNYYYDDPVSKTRFICLDTGRWYEVVLRGSTFKTAKFVVDCLSSVPDGWHIIAASHIWSNLKSFETGVTQESVYVRPIIEILENYNNRLGGAFSYEGDTLTYDFTNVGAMIEYCIGGHTHSDAIVFSKGGLPLITITSDGQIEVAGGAPYQTGTINEQCVTIVVNDYKNRKVIIYHIGRGEDVSVNMWEPI